MSKDERIAHLARLLKNAYLRRFRDGKREEETESNEDNRKSLVDILGDKDGETLQMYSRGRANFAILIGTFPIPGGARSPLSRASSHLYLVVVYACVKYQFFS